MKFETDNRAWAERVFGNCDLGDERRVNRLVELATLAAGEPEASTSAMCHGDRAAEEGAYRFLRNPKFETADIDDGAYAATAEAARGLPLVLALQDTTAVSFTHATAQVLAEAGCPTGFLAHTTLFLDPRDKSSLGLVDQDRWLRQPKAKRAGKAARKERAYEDKESHRWEESCARMRGRLGEAGNVITVCDREADIFEFLHYQAKHRQRFVIRASNDRALVTTEKKYLWAALGERPVLGTRTVHVEQRGGQRASISQSERLPRKARETSVELRSAQVVLRPPDGKAADYAPLAVNVVLVREPNPPAGAHALEWMLLTTEPVTTEKQVEQVVYWYECRWVIEEYHKAWKSGCRIEKRPLMSVDTLERMVALTSHVAVRILQLHALANAAGSDTTPCDRALTTEEWHCLWASTSYGEPLPAEPPTLRWAYEAIGKLGGWSNSKRTGRIGWQALWEGWDTLQQRLAGWRAHAMLVAGGEM
jgi:hypothetical protein